MRSIWQRFLMSLAIAGLHFPGVGGPLSARADDAPKAASPSKDDLSKPEAPALSEAELKERRRQIRKDMSEIIAALHRYHEDHGMFPASEVLGPNGQTRHSWRVALLPYLGHKDLYEHYHFDEEWDSARNEKLLARMPKVYRSPFDQPDSAYSSYFVLTGKETAFGQEKSAALGDIPDGTERTVAFVEAKRQVPWTKPEDLPYDKDLPLPELGGWDAIGGEPCFRACLCDGAIRQFTTSFDPKSLRSFFTRNGGEESKRDSVPIREEKKPGT